MVWDIRDIAPPFNSEDDRVTIQCIWGCVHLAMHSIQNERAAREYFYRAQYWTVFNQGDPRLPFGRTVPFFDGLTLADVVKRIGLRTGVAAQSRPVWQAQLAKSRVEHAKKWAQAELHFQEKNLLITQGDKSR